MNNLITSFLPIPSSSAVPLPIPSSSAAPLPFTSSAISYSFFQNLFKSVSVREKSSRLSCNTQ